MRSIFSSQRVETAEGVAQKLRDAGIEVRVTNGRSYRSRRSGQFSFLDKRDPKNEPTVWVVHAEQQVQAREILRQAGLLETTRRDPGTAHSYSLADVTIAPRKPANWGWRIRIGLLLVIAAVALVVVLQRPSAPAPATAPAATPTPAPEQPAPQPAESDPGVGEDEYRVRIVPAG